MSSRLFDRRAMWGKANLSMSIAATAAAQQEDKTDWLVAVIEMVGLTLTGLVMFVVWKLMHGKFAEDEGGPNSHQKVNREVQKRQEIEFYETNGANKLRPLPTKVDDHEEEGEAQQPGGGGDGNAKPKKQSDCRWTPPSSASVSKSKSQK